MTELPALPELRPTHATLPLWADAPEAGRLEKLKQQVEDLYRYALGPAMNRIIAMLRAHPCADEKEARDRDFIIAQCMAHPTLFNMSCEHAHLTGSALVAHPASGRVLLNHHKKLGMWMQFGGHFDYEVEPWRVALREAHEETGLADLRFMPESPDPAPFDIDAHVIPARGGRPEHLHLDLRFLLATDSPDQAQATAESHAIRWLTLEETQTLTLDPGVRRMLDKARGRMA